jgi:hypothetical protein
MSNVSQLAIGNDGKYYLEAGAVLVPGQENHGSLLYHLILTSGFWRLEDKIGMSLDDIHLGGNVPHCMFPIKHAQIHSETLQSEKNSSLV